SSPPTATISPACAPHSWGRNVRLSSSSASIRRPRLKRATPSGSTRSPTRLIRELGQVTTLLGEGEPGGSGRSASSGPSCRHQDRKADEAGHAAVVPPATDFICKVGGAEGSRTPDPKTASLVLSQLTYSPTRRRPYRRAWNLVKEWYRGRGLNPHALAGAKFCVGGGCRSPPPALVSRRDSLQPPGPGSSNGAPGGPVTTGTETFRPSDACG